MAVGIDGWVHIIATDERIVGRNAAVVFQAQYFAVHTFQILRVRAEWRAGGHEQRAIAGEHNA